MNIRQRMIPLSGLDQLWRRSKLFLRLNCCSFFSFISTETSSNLFFFSNSSTPELNPTEDSIELAPIPPYTSQRSHSSPSVTYESLTEDHSDPQSVIENLSEEEVSNPATIIITSPSFQSDQTDSIESLNSPLEHHHRRIDHRRNRSEPVKSLSNEDLHSSTNLDSSLSNNAREEPRRKSSNEKILTTTRKKKAWYNVSEFPPPPHLSVRCCCCFFRNA